MKINVLVNFDNKGVVCLISGIAHSIAWSMHFEKFGTLYENVCKYSSLLLIAVD